MNPLVLTFDNLPNTESKRFMKTLEDNEWEYILVGENTEWINFLERARSYLFEIQKISKESPDRILVISDCRDVLCVRHSSAFIDIFKTFKKPIVCSAELFCGGAPIYEGKKNSNVHNCMDISKYWNDIGVENPPARKFVNAGLISGKASALAAMFDWMVSFGDSTNLKDDQLLLGIFLNNYPDLVALDSDVKLLHTSTFGVGGGYFTESQIQDSPTLAQILGRSSFFLHIPGANTAKGNSVIYRIVSELIDSGINRRSILDIYNLPDKLPYDFYKYIDTPPTDSEKKVDK